MSIKFDPVIESLLQIGFNQMCTNAASCMSCHYCYTDKLYQCYEEYRKDIIQSLVQSLKVNYSESDILKFDILKYEDK